jgi:GNAT superfamily N-acetyltransferase
MIERHPSAAAFLERAGARLIEDEARYHLILGIARRLEEHPEATPDGAYFATVDDDFDVMSAAIMTPPHGLVTTALGKKGIAALVDDLGSRAIPSIHAPVETSDAFARAHAERRGCLCEMHWDLRIHVLDAVAEVKTAKGALRKARIDEHSFYTQCVRAFREAVGEHVELSAEEVANRHLHAGSVWFWEDDGKIVSTALATGSTPHGVRIGAVWTPKELRGRGYATSCVAALSRAMLAAGKRWCFLYTDVKNPTSNAIYARIGYRPVADFREWTFHSKV